MSQAGDAHMHHPEEFDPKAPRDHGQDGMVAYPGLRADCELCQSRKTVADLKTKAKAP